MHQRTRGKCSIDRGHWVFKSAVYFITFTHIMKNFLPSIDRREFIKHSGIAVGGTMLFWSGCKSKSNEQWLFLTEAEAQTVIAMSSRVIPTDDMPGAVEAGVVHFIDQQLVGYHKRWSLVYREGLKGIEKISTTLHSKGFSKLLPEQMDSLLEQVEEGSIANDLNPGGTVTRFFNLFIDHCMQGFYGDPRHGGNREWVSYQMLDLPVIDPETVKLS